MGRPAGGGEGAEGGGVPARGGLNPPNGRHRPVVLLMQRPRGGSTVTPKVSWLYTTLLIASASALEAQTSGPQFINPPGLAKPTGFTHVVVSADRRTAYIAGQVARDSTGGVV